MNDSAKARLCLQQIVDLFKTGNVPKALAVVTIPPQAGIPSAGAGEGCEVPGVRQGPQAGGRER